MNNPNPFVPKGSLLEQQSKRRSRLKLAVFCVLAVGVAGLAAILIQGCKREQTENPPESENQPPVDTNNVMETDTNPPPTEASNPPIAAPPQEVMPPPVTSQPPEVPEGSEYIIVKGDTFSRIAKEHGVTVKAVEDANPNVEPTKLKVGQKLVIPAATGGNAGAETEAGISTGAGGEETYTVKSGDTLTRIARQYGVTVKAIETENDLSTTVIKVGQKLKIPAKIEAAPAGTTVNEPPVTPAPAPAPTSPQPPPGNPPAQQQ